jgi:cysteine desulfurase
MVSGMTPKQSPVYLDYNATTPLRAEVAALMTEKMCETGNASSVHSFGRNMRKDIETAREQIAKFVQCDPIDIVFTSGATEANNAVIFGAPVQRVLYSAIEHPSVIDAAIYRGNAFAIPVLPTGIVDLEALEKILVSENIPTLVSVMWVNNETGVIQPVAEIAAMAKKYGCLFHCDAVQAAGKLPLHMNGIDYLTISAHKIGGPSGIGALIYNHETQLQKFIHGGGQERRRRAGTENTLGAIGFGLAAQLASKEQNDFATWRDHCETEMQKATPHIEFVGRDAPRVANTIQVILPSVPAETQLMSLDLDGIAVSSGSACSSGSIKPSHVLLAMGVDPAKARCAIRVSMGHATTKEQLDRFLASWVTNSQRWLKV